MQFTSWSWLSSQQTKTPKSCKKRKAELSSSVIMKLEYFGMFFSTKLGNSPYGRILTHHGYFEFFLKVPFFCSRLLIACHFFCNHVYDWGFTELSGVKKEKEMMWVLPQFYFSWWHKRVFDVSFSLSPPSFYFVVRLKPQRPSSNVNRCTPKSRGKVFVPFLSV